MILIIIDVYIMFVFYLFSNRRYENDYSYTQLLFRGGVKKNQLHFLNSIQGYIRLYVAQFCTELKIQSIQNCFFMKLIIPRSLLIGTALLLVQVVYGQQFKLTQGIALTQFNYLNEQGQLVDGLKSGSGLSFQQPFTKLVWSIPPNKNSSKRPLRFTFLKMRRLLSC